jgi:aromatic ring hydroxylase
MNDFDGMSEQDIRLLMIEAASIHSRAEVRILTRLVLQMLKNSGASKIGGMTFEEFFQSQTKKELQTFLPGLADMSAERASKIARILGIDPPTQ